jgi:predicted RNase H-like nuclease (RuvC/YqgF family)
MIKFKKLAESMSPEEAYKPLAQEEKVKLRETVKAYNEYRNALKAEAIYATAAKISEAINLAERYALRECGEWMEAKMVERDMKEVKKLSNKLVEEANKIKEVEHQLEMLYEEIGLKLERYFEIADPVEENSELPGARPIVQTHQQPPYQD